MSQVAYRGLSIVRRNDQGGLELLSNPRADGSLVTRAYKPVPDFAAITDIVGMDGEFQQVFIVRIGKSFSRAGRTSIVNVRGGVIYDVFSYYPEIAGYEKRLPPKRLKLGVYWQDLKPKNGACPIEEVEYNMKQIFARAKVVVGHSIANDIKVYSADVFDGIEVRDTQLYEPYRVHGKFPRRLPKLSVLAHKIFNAVIQADDHSSVEDAQYTLMLALRVWPDLDQQQKGRTAQTMLEGATEDLYGDDDQPYELEEDIDMTEIAKVCLPNDTTITALPEFNVEAFPKLVLKTNTAQPTGLAASAFWQARLKPSSAMTNNQSGLSSAAQPFVTAGSQTTESDQPADRDEEPILNSTHNKKASVTSLNSHSSTDSLFSHTSTSTAATKLSDISVPKPTEAKLTNPTAAKDPVSQHAENASKYQVAQSRITWAGFRKGEENASFETTRSEKKSSGKVVLKTRSNKKSV